MWYRLASYDLNDIYIFRKSIRFLVVTCASRSRFLHRPLQ